MFTRSATRATGRPTGLASLLAPLSVLGFGVAVIAVLIVAAFSYQAHQNRSVAGEAVSHTLEVISHVQSVLSTMKDAETGQRGFLLTGSEIYAQPYDEARTQLGGQLRALRDAVAGNPRQLQAVSTMEQLANEKLTELGQTMALQRAGNHEAAMALVRTDRGREAMDRIRAAASDLETQERASFQHQRESWSTAITLSLAVTWGGAGLLLTLILIAAVISSRQYRQRENEAWLRAGQASLSINLQGELRLDRLAEQVLAFLARYLDAQVGAFYVALNGRFQRLAAFAAGRAPDTVDIGDGLLGQAARENRPLHVRDVPPAYLQVASTLGNAPARELLLGPAAVDGVVQCVVELGFFRRLEASDLELLTRAAHPLAMAVRAAKDRTRLEELLEETQRQAEELQSQQEELRVNNEELEEQSRALRESQARLENQQVELEQTNVQLEEQAQLLETQKDDLAAAQDTMVQRARELERANQYKSEFLANMSHELRTPLNSTLILAKLLADNKTGNLSAEQVKFAQTIANAGTDLLTLINDILDLSKIEAGKVDMHIERVPLRRFVDAMNGSFEAVAQQRKLGFEASVEPGAPEAMSTDEGRVGQILKNLIANAIKFTEKGKVSLRIASAAGGQVAFSVIDTGIGIADHQRDVIFEAFRQADGSTHRKYGGTGLGLSIARDLARLLGGDIAVDSTVGKGSVFTLTLPRDFEAGADAAPAAPQAAPPAGPPRAPAPPLVERRTEAPQAPPVQRVADDREDLVHDKRLILVIEDDVSFAEILRDVIREQGFQCVVALTGHEGLAAAQHHLPSAILLDMRLPEHSGMGVLDLLKRNSLTRHIPVHVVSVGDYSHEALEMGAVGYAFKPVKREELIEALRRLESHFVQGVRRVLVVEDDPVQRDAIHHLLAHENVQIITADTAADALRQLKASTFDCMVLDVNLPDLSGYELLETMSAKDGVSFPPVIVYTGRSLNSEQEQQLRRYSRSIIIKDARSPERLLDEVTLFLHQVEAQLPADRQRMLKVARNREAALEGRCVLVVEDDVRNVFALSAVLEPFGMRIAIARNGREALDALAADDHGIDLVLMDIMMPEMDGLTAMRELRKRPALAKLPIIALTAKAMRDDQERCIAAGASDYIAKPLDVEKLLSLIRVWMPK